MSSWPRADWQARRSVVDSNPGRKTSGPGVFNRKDDNQVASKFSTSQSASCGMTTGQYSTAQ